MYKGRFSSGGANRNAHPSPAAPKKKRRAKRSGKLFYTLYALLILLSCIGLGVALYSLNGWLVRYEASQPDVKCREVFSQLFEDPDWEELYRMAGNQETAFEGAGAYAAYMREISNGSPLTYSETSAGLSGDHKYIVRMGQEKIAVFTLTSEKNPDDPLQQWRLGNVELVFSRNHAVTIQVMTDREVQVNGVPLDNSYLIRSTSTMAEGYLPDGIHGLQTRTYYVDGLLLPPEVTATDETGAGVPLLYDADKLSYYEAPPQFSYEGLEDRILGAAKVYCQYMIRAVYANQLKKYFDPDSEIYDNIRRNETWMQRYSSYEMGEGEISEFYRYDDNNFSARVQMKMYVTRLDGTVREYQLNSTFFFGNLDGKWMATEMTNVDVQAEVSRVRLRFCQDGEILQSEMVDSDASKLTPPPVTPPQGKVFAGWFQETQDEQGSTTYHLVFPPSEDGTVTIPAGTVLEPMTLYALFENERTE